MKYKHTVKKDGILYKPGMEVPGDVRIKAKSGNGVVEPQKTKRGRKPKEA